MAPNVNTDADIMIGAELQSAIMWPGAVPHPQFYQPQVLPQVLPTPVFGDGFQHCGESAIQYLLEVEKYSVNHPVVEGLRQHILEVQQRLGLCDLPVYNHSSKHRDYKPWQPWVEEPESNTMDTSMDVCDTCEGCEECVSQKQIHYHPSTTDYSQFNLSPTNSTSFTSQHTSEHSFQPEFSETTADMDMYANFTKLCQEDDRVAQATEDLINVLSEELTPQEVDLIDMDILADNELL